MFGDPLSDAEIDEIARYMAVTADPLFYAFARSMEQFIRSLGVEMSHQQEAQLVSLLRQIDGHRCEQVKALMKTARDCMNLTPHPLIFTSKDTE